MPARVRPLTADDVAQVAGIEARAFSDPWSPGSFYELMEQKHVHALAAVDDDGVLVGYAFGSSVAGEGEVLNVAVEPSARRQGIGRLLMDELLAWLKQTGAEAVYLEVRRSNEAAIGLYTGYGFRELSTRKGYYRAPREDAVVMILDGRRR